MTAKTAKTAKEIIYRWFVVPVLVVAFLLFLAKSFWSIIGARHTDSTTVCPACGAPLEIIKRDGA